MSRRMVHDTARLHALLGGLVLLLAGCVARTPVGPPWVEVDGPWEHRFVDLPDRVDGGPLRMHYVVAGPEDGDVVVLVHGFPDIGYGWRSVLPLLATDHRVYAPDLRGYGGTDRPATGYAFTEIVADLAAFLQAAPAADGREGPVHLVGHDWGAATSWGLAMTQPELLRTLTVLSVPHPQAWADTLAEDKKQRRRASYQTSFAKPSFAKLLAGLGAGQVAGVYRSELVHKDALSPADAQVYSDAFCALEDWDPPLRYYRERLANAESEAAAVSAAPPVAVPTLVLWGAQDGFLFAENAERSCTYVASDCAVTVIEDAGHFMHWEVADAIVARWRTFTKDAP